MTPKLTTHQIRSITGNKSSPITTIGVVVAIVASLSGGVIWVDSRYAYAEDAQKYHQELETTLITIQLSNIDERVYRILKQPEAEQDKAMLYKLQKESERLQIRYEALVNDPG